MSPVLKDHFFLCPKGHDLLMQVCILFIPHNKKKRPRQCIIIITVGLDFSYVLPLGSMYVLDSPLTTFREVVLASRKKKDPTVEPV